MRRGLVQVGVLFIVCLLVGDELSVHGQTVADRVPETLSNKSCPPSTVHDQLPPGPEISIAGVSFSGALQMPVGDQEEIAESVKRESHGNSVERVTNEALEKVRAGWQDRGYFKVLVSGQARTLTNTPGNQRIALFVNVDEGPQYRLGGITFKNNRAISNAKALRRLFPIEDGDVFSREKIVKGLWNLRYAYLELGYLNFTGVPDTLFDDEGGAISLTIDVDEGKQFYVRSIDVRGPDDSARQEMLKAFPVGKAYNARLFDLFLKKHPSLFQFSSDDPWHVTKQLDERTGTVAITLDAHPCPMN